MDSFEVIRHKHEQHLKQVTDAVRVEHKVFLERLEIYAVWAIINNDWSEFYYHLHNFQDENDLHGICGATPDDVEGDDENQNLNALVHIAFGERS